MFLSRKKKNKAYPCKPQFYYIQVGFKGSKLYRHVFVMNSSDFKSLNPGLLVIKDFSMIHTDIFFLKLFEISRICRETYFYKLRCITNDSLTDYRLSPVLFHLVIHHNCVTESRDKRNSDTLRWY